MVADTAMVDEDDQPNAEHPLTETEWTTLVNRVVKGACTPFLGAGVAWPFLPTGKELATTLADKFEYPLPDPTNLPRVAQYVATLHKDPSYAQGQVREEISARQKKFIESSDVDFPQNYRILANLRLPIYITTNYDDFLTRALKAAGRDPRVEVCRWNNWLYEDHEYSEDEPTEDHPLVFHLHGDLSDEGSLLVTEDDYIDFTVSLSQRGGAEDPVIPHWIRRALGRTTLLFVGYSLEDWNFRILMRQLIEQLRVLRHQQSPSISIQLSDTTIPPKKRQAAQRFLAEYLDTTSAIRVYWGQAEPFLKELDKRCRIARDGQQQG